MRSMYHMNGAHIYRDGDVVATINTEIKDWREIRNLMSAAPELKNTVDSCLALIDALSVGDKDDDKMPV